MSATVSLASEFSAAARKRGERYFADGRVQIYQSDSKILAAKVDGTSRYTVTLEVLDDEDLMWECSCPYCVLDCKHVWATLLAAQQANWAPIRALGRDASPSRAPVIIDVSSSWASAPQRVKPPKPRVVQWEAELKRAKDRMTGRSTYNAPTSSLSWPAEREICYVINVSASLSQQVLIIDVLMRDSKKSGKPGRWKHADITSLSWQNAPADDQVIGQMLSGCRDQYGYGGSSFRFRIDDWKYQTMLSRIGQTGRCRVESGTDGQPGDALTWYGLTPWKFHVEVRPAAKSGYEIVGMLRRDCGAGDERMELHEPKLLMAGGVLIARGQIARLEHAGAFELLMLLREKPNLPVSKKALPQLLQRLCEFPRLPKVDWPADFAVDVIEPEPRPMLKIRAPGKGRYNTDDLVAHLSFKYDQALVDEEDPSSTILQSEPRRMIRRNAEMEARLQQRLTKAGFRQDWNYGSPYGAPRREWRLRPPQLSSAVAELTRDGWHIEADGKLFRSGGEMRIDIASGIDWFDLNGRAEFGDTGVALPRLLQAVEKGLHTVVLDDGTFGIIPEEWLKKYAPIVQMGEAHGDAIRFGRSQVGLLDAMLATMPEARCDETFNRVRQELANFKGIAPMESAAGFRGQLRDYQQEGLGWLAFLQKFSFGGCLADDMGLGKTVQILALLHHRREQGHGTSLVVVPRSLIFNWKQEAARFTPDLSVLDQTGASRSRGGAEFDQHHLVLTTYGTLRRNITDFKDFQFDYVILDESQAIKNADTQSAKAARLLRGKHRLALSGTPIENHLGELWSLFEFLNPKMLGSANCFRNLIQSNGQVDGANKSLLAAALRPFILRRTKSQVARELPDKIEQTIVCQLEGDQRKLYDDLKDHYRASLLGLIEKNGIKRSKIQILEALLRLRQAACHPGLIDKSCGDQTSSKLQALLANLREVLAEGHKVLVFSQFTSMLAIVRKALDRENIVYEYLDGKTRDRQAKVERFQNDGKCPVFLISLKAGGVGLNLTAAEYVFLLDPWWNPAVEAQAVDRAHRIGQSRTVFAYRLIAKDTVEDKILELQKTKRDLADAIITEDNSVIGRMGADELRMLLS